MRLNKIVVLMILVFVAVVFTGCSSKPPEGIDKDLWRDSAKVVKIIKDAFDKDNNFSVKDEEVIEEYFKTYKGRLYDNIDENILVNDIYQVHDKYTTYIFSKKTFSNKQIVDNDKQKVVDLLDKLRNTFDENLIK